MDSTAKIRDLNDAFRTAFAGDGRVYVTASIAALSPEQQVEVMRRVHGFIAFTPDNDPHGEHDSAASITRARPFSGNSIATIVTSSTARPIRRTRT